MKIDYIPKDFPLYSDLVESLNIVLGSDKIFKKYFAFEFDYEHVFYNVYYDDRLVLYHATSADALLYFFKGFDFALGFCKFCI